MKSEYLVAYDYGMGGLWAYVRAESEAEILAAFPELQVVHERPHWMDVKRAATLDKLTSLPSSQTQPLIRSPQARPNRLMANSVRPAPISPAIPTTSPRRTSKSAPLMTRRSRCSG